jgi:hypothetical protein
MNTRTGGSDRIMRSSSRQRAWRMARAAAARDAHVYCVATTACLPMQHGCTMAIRVHSQRCSIAACA